MGQPIAARVRTVAPPDGVGVLLLLDPVAAPTTGFADLAHAIRNPLATIFCLSGILPAETQPAGEDSGVSLHDRFVDEADRLAALADDIAALAKPLTPRSRRADLVGVAREIEAALKDGDARVDGTVPVVVSVGEALRAEPACVTDPEILRTLVLRLVRRARMSFEDTPVTVRLDRSAAGVVLHVSGGPLLPGRGAGVALATIVMAAQALGGSVDAQAETAEVRVVMPQPDAR